MAAAELTSARVLCIGDLHIGRTPSRIPPNLLAEAGLTVADTLPAAALRRAVDIAVSERFDAVVMAGDLVDAERAFYAAEGALMGEVGRLADAGIPVYAVAGNHDGEIMPRIATELSNFHTVGAPGEWGIATVGPADAPRLVVVGWSHPGRHVTDSPLATFPHTDVEALRRAHPKVPVVGLAHVDRDAPASRYAPVSTAELKAAPVDGWILGHVHVPDLDASPGTGGYLGSLQGLDPGERGWRGAWELKTGSAGLAATRRSVAAVRYETVVHEVTGDDPKYGLRQALGEHLVAIDSEQDGQSVAVSFRVVLAGDVDDPAAVLAAAHEGVDELTVRSGSVVGAVERFESHLTARIDLAQWSGDAGPIGIAAQAALEPGGARFEELRRDLERMARADGLEVAADELLADAAAELVVGMVAQVRAPKVGSS